MAMKLTILMRVARAPEIQTRRNYSLRQAVDDNAAISTIVLVMLMVL